MKLWTLLGALVSLVTSTPLDALDREIAATTRDGERTVEVRGIGIQGPDFYVWDEDPEAALDWARELGRR